MILLFLSYAIIIYGKYMLELFKRENQGSLAVDYNRRGDGFKKF